MHERKELAIISKGTVPTVFPFSSPSKEEILAKLFCVWGRGTGGPYSLMLWLTQCDGSPSVAPPAAEAAGMVVK